MDCLAGFQGNTARVERQKARVLRPERRTLKDGVPNVMYASFEDPSQPDVIHHRIIAVESFLRDNAERGFNHEQVCWSIITFIFAYWDEEIRPQIARIRGVDVQAVRVEAMGDLRLLRNAIIHNKGILPASDHAKMTKLKDLVRPGERVTLSYDEMHGLFVQVKKAIGALVMTYTSHLPGAPNTADIADVAIQNVRPPRGEK